MKFDCKNKLVLVTGAASGIGRATAVKFAEKGARVALTDKNEAGLESASAEIKNRGGISAAFPFDLSATGGCGKLTGEVNREFGDTVDILVNVAGIGILGYVEDVPVEGFQENLEINFFAPLALIKAVVPGMKAKGRGQIINITSGVGSRGLPGVSPYCVSKAALNSMTESIRVELARYRIQVLLVSPGLTGTNFVRSNKVYGGFSDVFNQGDKLDPAVVAEKIVQASAKAKRDVVLSLRTRLGSLLNFLAPGVLDKILSRKISSGDADK